MSGRNEKVDIWGVEGWFKHYVFPIYIPITFTLGLCLVWYQRFPDKWIDGVKNISDIGLFSVISLFIVHEGVSLVTLAVEYFRKDNEKRIRRSERIKTLEELRKGEHIDEKTFEELRSRLEDENN